MFRAPLRAVIEVLRADFSLTEWVPPEQDNDFLASIGRELEIDADEGSPQAAGGDDMNTNALNLFLFVGLPYAALIVCLVGRHLSLPAEGLHRLLALLAVPRGEGPLLGLRTLPRGDPGGVLRSPDHVPLPADDAGLEQHAGPPDHPGSDGVHVRPDGAHRARRADVPPVHEPPHPRRDDRHGHRARGAPAGAGRVRALDRAGVSVGRLVVRGRPVAVPVVAAASSPRRRARCSRFPG